MGKSYAERNQESIAKYGKSLYQRRIEGAQAKGLSKSQARGHARTNRGEVKPSTLRAQRAPKGTQGHKPPKITKRFQTLKNGTRIVNTRSPEQIARTLNAHIRGSKGGKLDRIYFQVFDPSTGKMVNVYYGKQGKTGFHGITVEEFLRRVDTKMQSGDYDTFEDAMWDVIEEDGSQAGDSGDSGTGENGTIPSAPSQVSMYIRSAV